MSTPVVCCYCGSKETATEAPPCLHTCSACKHDFRVIIPPKKQATMTLSKQAQGYYKGVA